MLAMDQAALAARDSLLTVAYRDGVAVATLLPAALRERAAMLFGRELNDLADRTGGRVVLVVPGGCDLSCAAINALLAATDQCERLGGHLLIVGLPPAVMRLLRSTGLSARLHFAASERQGLALLAEARAAA